jgi:hypothetical protein
MLVNDATSGSVLHIQHAAELANKARGRRTLARRGVLGARPGPARAASAALLARPAGMRWASRSGATSATSPPCSGPRAPARSPPGRGPPFTSTAGSRRRARPQLPLAGHRLQPEPRRGAQVHPGPGPAGGAARQLAEVGECLGRALTAEESKAAPR